MLQRPNESRLRPEDSSTEPSPTGAQTDSRSPSNDACGIYGHQRPSYQSHDPSTLQFPDAPTTDLPPIQPASALGLENGNALPSLLSVTGCQSLRHAPSQVADSSNTPQPPPAPSQWAAQGHRDGFQPRAAESPARMDAESSSNSAVSAASPEYFDGRAGSVSLDDPDVRLAAEALGDLRAGMLT